MVGDNRDTCIERLAETLGDGGRLDHFGWNWKKVREGRKGERSEGNGRVGAHASLQGSKEETSAR